ncbi:MAG: GNAT family N-acetyltransferase [Candidatus Eremiobacteraeota bacterium]|nr:GNAT family N-acetyltransferase [Candidatus Eremiobacteraeota bacterium]
MPVWRVRDFNDGDFDRAMGLLLGESLDPDAQAVFPLAEVLDAVRAGQPALVAEVGDELVGAVFSGVSGERAWISRLAVATPWRNHGIGSSLLAHLERRLVEHGARRALAFVPSNELEASEFGRAGFVARQGIVVFEWIAPMNPVQLGLVESLGGIVLQPGGWAAVAGMDREKALIESRVVLPLERSEEAVGFGVSAPRAIVLFGPPGTGKTTFAKAVSSRLGWPFVEIFPSRLGAESLGGLAVALRDIFTKLEALERLVLFIDEVEEIAPARDGQVYSPVHAVTNELLKLLPVFREREQRLLVCATNSVRSLDAAFLRPGRFDYVLPIGPPDPVARRAIWARFVPPAAASVDLDAVVEASDLFTPADIEFAAGKAAHAAFERFVGASKKGAAATLTTQDYLEAIANTRPTLTPQMVADFTADIESFARL